MLCRCDATLEQQYSSLSTTTHKLTVFIGRTQRSRLRQPVHYLCTNVQTETFVQKFNGWLVKSWT